MTALMDLPNQIDALDRTRFRLTEDTALVEIGGQPALFSQRGETLYALDGAAADAATCLAAGASFVAFAEASGQGGAVGRRFARTLLRQWSALGIAEADIAPIRPDLGWRRTIRIASLTAELACASATLHRRVSPVFGHFAASAGVADMRFNLAETDGLVLVSVDGAGAAIVSAREAAPLIKGLLIREVLAAAPPDIALHAACLAAANRALLLTGAPGAGKTTLAIALAAAGFGFAADDITLLAPDGRVHGVPFAPTAKAGAWPLLRPLSPDLDDRPVHLRLDGIRVRYLPPPDPPLAGALPVGWIVHLRRAEGASPRLVPLGPTQALARLTEEAHSARGPADLGALQTLIGVAERARAFDLVYSDLGDAVRILTGACADA